MIRKNDNIIFKARDITWVGAGVGLGVGDKTRHHRPIGRQSNVCVHAFIEFIIRDKMLSNPHIL